MFFANERAVYFIIISLRSLFFSFIFGEVRTMAVLIIAPRKQLTIKV